MLLEPLATGAVRRRAVDLSRPIVPVAHAISLVVAGRFVIAMSWRPIAYSTGFAPPREQSDRGRRGGLNIPGTASLPFPTAGTTETSTCGPCRPFRAAPTLVHGFGNGLDVEDSFSVEHLEAITPGNAVRAVVVFRFQSNEVVYGDLTGYHRWRTTPQRCRPPATRHTRCETIFSPLVSRSPTRPPALAAPDRLFLRCSPARRAFRRLQPSRGNGWAGQKGGCSIRQRATFEQAQERRRQVPGPGLL